MKAPRKASQKAKSPGQRRLGAPHSMVWMQGLLCGALFTLATPTASLFAVLLLPGLLAVVLDRAAGKPVARTMLLFGLAASVGPVRLLWQEGHTLRVALALAFDPRILGLAWMAGAGGWLASELLPLVARLLLEAGCLSRSKALRAERAGHEEEWGLPPAGKMGGQQE